MEREREGRRREDDERARVQRPASKEEEQQKEEAHRESASVDSDVFLRERKNKSKKLRGWPID